MQQIFKQPGENDQNKTLMQTSMKGLFTQNTTPENIPVMLKEA